MRSLHWQESSDGQGGWLVSGCDEGTVGVSWAGNRACEFAGREDNVACAEGACYYKSHFILKEHVGEVSDALLLRANSCCIGLLNLKSLDDVGAWLVPSP